MRMAVIIAVNANDLPEYSGFAFFQQYQGDEVQ